MQLKDFVQQTLVEIVQGVYDAQPLMREHNARVGSMYEGEKRQFVKFDVAVASGTTDTKSGEAGAHIYVVDTGGEWSRENANVALQRVRFSVPIEYPPSEANPDA